jgi:hypothetical protein
MPSTRVYHRGTQADRLRAAVTGHQVWAAWDFDGCPRTRGRDVAMRVVRSMKRFSLRGTHMHASPQTLMLTLCLCSSDPDFLHLLSASRPGSGRPRSARTRHVASSRLTSTSPCTSYSSPLHRPFTVAVVVSVRAALPLSTIWYAYSSLHSTDHANAP